MSQPLGRCLTCGSENVDIQTGKCLDCGTKGITRHLASNMAAVSFTPDVQITVIQYHQTLLEFAKSLVMDAKQFGIAIVVAHMACEMAVERVVAQFTAGVPQNANMYGYNIASDRNLRKYRALTGDNIQQQTSFWQKFTDSAERRNQIMHNRYIAIEPEAEESIQTTSAFITYLEQKFNISQYYLEPQDQRRK